MRLDLIHHRNIPAIFVFSKTKSDNSNLLFITTAKLKEKYYEKKNKPIRN